MKKFITNLSFGFEVEGKFDKKLLNDFDSDLFKLDGSVSVPMPKKFVGVQANGDECGSCSGSGTYDCDSDCGDDCNGHDCNDCSGTGNTGEGEAEEFASEIYQDLSECLTALSKFNKKTHAFDQSCGLHFHIGLKSGSGLAWQKFYSVMCNLDFMQKLQKEACDYCQCQKNRLMYSDCHFYPFWENKHAIIQSLGRAGGRGNTEKFRFMNYHTGYKTLEFRFLCPCEHKVENVKKLVDSVVEYLDEKSKIKLVEYAENSRFESVLDLVDKIKLPAISRLRL